LINFHSRFTESLSVQITSVDDIGIMNSTHNAVVEKFFLFKEHSSVHAIHLLGVTGRSCENATIDAIVMNAIYKR
jgi:hypothetical protein